MPEIWGRVGAKVVHPDQMEDAMSEPNVPIVDRDTLTDPELLKALEHTDVVKTPPTQKLLAMAHAPEIAKGMAEYWRLTAESGSVDPSIKELGRLAIAQLLGCPVCSNARSTLVPVDEDVVCTLPAFDHPDPATRAALQFARALVRDEEDFAARYQGLAELFNWAQIVELAAFFCLVIGDVKMVKSFGMEGLIVA
jgi:alkylhydroperoxidase family enzyme